MNDKIEVSTSAARQLLPYLEEKVEQMTTERDGLSGEIERTLVTIEELKAKLSGSELPLANGGKLRKRLPKGFAEDAIAKALGSIKVGEHLSLPEIVNKTGIKYSTVFKILMDSKRNKGKFVKSDKENSFRLK
jgi:DNA-binding IclR family transcriptional regulator